MLNTRHAMPGKSGTSLGIRIKISGCLGSGGFLVIFACSITARIIKHSVPECPPCEYLFVLGAKKFTVD